ncbi:MAG: glycerol-3-phosphate acyltransferase [Candidatus Bathyarchaeota archaeon]|nr:glycerol-3-phosphate acyltransferase [Candidatus Bathyarchaeota archaeon]
MNLLLSMIISFSGYLIGSVSFTRLIGKLVLPGEDLECSTVLIDGTNESFSFRSVSATTMRARAGAKYGIIASILDMSKAAIPITIVLICLGSQAYAYLVSAVVILGHDFPIYYRFRGGRGVSCLLGSLVFFDWISIPVSIALSLGIGLFVIDDAFIAYLSMPIYLIPWTLITTGASQFSAYAIVVNAIYWIALIPEIREYVNFRRTVAYEKAKKARHERAKKRISKLFSKLRTKRK